MAKVETRSPGDVAIIGASTTGLFTALLLARAGRRVEVFDRSTLADPLRRTLIVTARMREHIGDLGETSVVDEVRRFELFAGSSTAIVDVDPPDLIIERSDLVRALAKEAIEAGVELSLGTRFLGLEPARDRVKLLFEGSPAVESAVVIGADGARSRVAAAAGLKVQPCVPLVQAIVARPDDLPAHTSRVWFRPDDTPYFFWLIPESDATVGIGVIGSNGKDARCALNRFLEEHRLAALEHQAALIPAYSRWRSPFARVGGADVYLVGDAAGHVKVSTVGGIVTGFRGAAAIAEQILHGNNRALRRLRLELDAHLLVRRGLHPFSANDYERLLKGLNRASKSVFERYSRDETVAMIATLARKHPAILAKGLRSYLSGGLWAELH
jgi:flavin-dependent dehydrogenase